MLCRLGSNKVSADCGRQRASMCKDRRQSESPAPDQRATYCRTRVVTVLRIHFRIGGTMNAASTGRLRLQSAETPLFTVHTTPKDTLLIRQRSLSKHLRKYYSRSLLIGATSSAGHPCSRSIRLPSFQDNDVREHLPSEAAVIATCCTVR